MSSVDEVLFSELALAGGKSIGVATLNVEKTLNSLNLNMVDLLTTQLKSWADDDHILMVMFEGAGDRAFCAGGDIQSLYRDMLANPKGPCRYCEDFFEREYRLDYLIRTYPKPTLVWAHGIVMGGGLGIASACSHRIGTEKTRIAMPEITIGLIPDAGATASFSAMPAHFAYFLAWTGANINGKDAHLVGLVDYLIPSDTKSTLLAALQDVDWSDQPGKDLDKYLSSRATDTLTNKGEEVFSQLEKHEELIRRVLEQCLKSDEPVATFVSHLPEFSVDPWLEKAAATFAAGSPTTAQIIAEQFARARQMNVKEMFMQELTLAVQCSRHPDFVEGVRALLIDKDNQPNWHYAVMGQVPADWIEAHFELPWDEHPMADMNS